MRIQTPVISRGLVPLLDVIFILLIFFLILPHGFEGEGQKFDEMNAALAQLDAKLQPLKTIQLDKNSKIIYAGQTFSREQFEKLLPSFTQETFVVVFAHYDAQEKMVVILKKILKASGFKYVVGTESR